MAAILSFAYTVSFIDRVVISLLIEPIKRDLSLSDTQASLLIGFSFILFYALLGFPIGRLADRWNRRNIIIAGVVLWSLMTTASGFAKNFWHLFVARVGVGIGEAALSPSAYSLISDLFPRQKLGAALSLYNMGIYAGSGLALVVGGGLIHLAANAEVVVLPVVGALAPWRYVLIMAGVLSLTVALLMLTVREPQRRESHDRPQAASGPPATLADTGAFILANRSVLLPHLLGFTVVSMVGYAIAAWVPTFFMRTYGMSVADVGFQYGVVVLFAGISGVLAGGWIADWCERGGFIDAKMRVAACGAALLTLPGVAGPLMPTASLALLVMGGTVFFASFPLGIGAAALQVVVPNRLRGQLSALFLILVSIGGVGLGPTLVALVTDYVLGDERALRYSLSITVGILAPLAGATLFTALRPFRAALQAQQRPAESQLRPGGGEAPCRE